MTTKNVAGAIQADANVCNALELPVKGVHAGGGLHLVIPPDFTTRITLGQDVPGCTYSRVEVDATMFVDDRVQALIAIPAIVNALSSPLQLQAALLITKLALAVAVTGSAIA